ncbi:MAG: SPFH domain-containing protein [Mucinivorans sp.]
MEKQFSGLKLNGFLVLFALILALALPIWLITVWHLNSVYGALAACVICIIVICTAGFIMIEPNDMRVMIFFGKYKGTIRDNGFFWVNPFYNKCKLTARARNLDVEPIKVNDKDGNPVMIGLVLVWKVTDSYKSMFDIDSSSLGNSANKQVLGLRMSAFQNFVSIQSDSALRNIASEYSYDNNDAEEQITLRSGGQQVAERLELELNNRLSLAGIEVVEARLNYLAYAPEIAAVMLRRQQASAIISAREKIVEGAVSMVKMALAKLSTENIVELDEDKKAAMVSNLLVVLCSDEQAQPVVNTGTLNH